MIAIVTDSDTVEQENTLVCNFFFGLYCRGNKKYPDILPDLDKFARGEKYLSFV